MANYNTAFLDFSGIVLYLTFSFGVQLNDHNWCISSELLAKQKALNGKKKTLPSHILLASLILSPLTGRVYSSQLMNGIKEHCRKIENILKCSKKKNSMISPFRENLLCNFNAISYPFFFFYIFTVTNVYKTYVYGLTHSYKI